MGYRSDVMCIMYARDAKNVDKVDAGGMTFIKAWLNSRLNEEEKNLFEFDLDDMVVFSVEQWKWYESYPDIQRLDRLFEEFMELCDTSNSGYHMEFMRVGESYDDVETRYSDWNHGLLSLHRSIYIDGR
jgi:hypothetical protein